MESPEGQDVMKKGSLQDFSPLPIGVNQYSLPFMEENRAVVLAQEGDCVVVGVTQRDTGELLNRILTFHNDKRITYILIEAQELQSYLSQQASEEDSPGSDPAVVTEKVRLDQLAEAAPVVNLVNSIFLEALSQGASDMHIEGFPTATIIRFRIEGTLILYRELPPGKFRGIASRIKILSGLNIMEKRLPQDGRLSADLGGRTIDMRVSIVPIRGGESLVLRILGQGSHSLSLSRLGLDPITQGHLEQVRTMSHGLYLVTGPTGSGKSTTLGALLASFPRKKMKIITLEDPVENPLEGVDQIQINQAIGLTFESLLRRILRQDPDVILVGEIRDGITAQLSLQAALTGHLVLASLHTNDALGAIPRLVNLGIAPYLVGAVFRGAMAQRLLRTNCPHCSSLAPLSRGDRLWLKVLGLDLRESTIPGKGCPQCQYMGYGPRLVMAESFLAGQDLEEALGETSRSSELMPLLRKEGFVTLGEKLVPLFTQGKISLGELKRGVLL